MSKMTAKENVAKNDQQGERTKISHARHRGRLMWRQKTELLGGDRLMAPSSTCKQRMEVDGEVLTTPSSPFKVADLHLFCEHELHKVVFGIDTAYGGNTSL